MEIPTEVAKNETQSLVNLVKKEAGYLCCFNSYAQEFEGRKERLNAELADVRRRIDKARGASHVTSAALQWKGEAEILIAGDTEKEKCFNDLCLNCWRQYRKGKDLAKRTLEIGKLLDRSNVIEDGAADLLGIKYHCIPTFMDFESRNSTFQDLKKALEDEENNIIGLHGLGGTGKTTMAKEVGAHLEGSTFGKVIFVVVSKPPDFKKLRREIARKLELELKDGEEEALQDRILAKIIALKEKLLIVLDDLWEEFDLNKELGIPLHHLHKRCTVLITTRNKDICPKMECQKEIHLEALTSEEALSLFLKHTNNSFNLDSLAPKIVKHCHGIPVVIVAVARSLKGRPDEVWKEALRNLESGDESILTVNDDLKEVYKGLKLSYDNLKHKKARELFLISSLFPEDFEIPKESLFRIGVGMGRFGEDDDYKKRRRNAIDAIVELQDSSLLLNAEMECVKMHDLVHEVALLIRKQNIQPVVESEQPREEGWKCLFCKNNDFPKQSDGGKLEILIMFLDPSCFSDLKVPDTFFSEMTKLKVLFLQTRRFLQISAPSLFPLIQSLQDLRTLKLRSFKSCCISMLGKLLNLETLWLDNCSINKLPEEKFELEKLRFLRIENCEIKMNNPFELIKACPKLEELTFLDNEYDKMENKDTISQKVSFHELDIYQISSEDLSDYFDQYGSLLSRCFQPGDSVHLISEATFKQLARTPELLILEGYEKTEHKNLIPDIVSVDDRGKTDLIILKLDSCPSMQCLIDGMNNHLYVNAFSNLVELSLYQMGLSDMLFNGNYNLCHLKTMKLKDCPKLTSIFLPSTARSLSLLEELKIKGCGALECILEDKSSRGEIIDDDGDNDQKSYGAMFSKLKILVIKSCGNLEKILPIIPDGGLLKSIAIRKCEKLKYIFDKFQELNVMLSPDLKMELSELPSLVGIFREYKKSISSSLQQPASTASSTKTRSLSWAQVCCFKSRATSEEANGAISTQEVDASTDRGAPSLAAQSLLVQAVKNVRKIKLFKCGNIISLSTLSIAASATALKTLTIRECHKLKCITTHEGNALGDKNNLSIFPTLEDLEIEDCKELEILFVSSISVGLEKLKSLTVEKVPKLKYVVGNYQKELYPSNQNQNDELCFNLPALETLNIQNAPMMNCICSKKYNIVNLTATEEVHTPTIGAPLFHVTHNLLKTIREIKLVECTDLISMTTLSIASTILLEVLTIRACGQLKCIVADEGDARTQINYNSVFPKLKRLEVLDCDALEYLFPAYAFRSPLYLESLKINEAPMLKYVFGRSQHGDSLNPNHQNIQTLIDFPALKRLSIGYLPKLVSIFPKKYYMRGLYLRFVTFEELPKFTMRPFNELLVCWHTEQHEMKVIEMCWKTLESVQVCDSKIEEIFDLTYMETKKKGDELQPLKLLNLSKLVNICVGPKCIIRFDSLRVLTIKACKKLRVIFSASTVRSLPMLDYLDISECEELVHIIEEDYERNADDHEPCFPKLERVYVSHCHKLKYLFSITISDILPKLRELRIREANELEHVLIKRDAMEEMFMKNVLPRLRRLALRNLPNLFSVCHGINFQEKYYDTKVYNCPKFETSTTQYQADPETGNSQVEEKAKERLSSHMVEEIAQQSLTKGATEEIVEEDFMSDIAKATISSSDSKLTGPLVAEARAKGVSSNTLYQISLTSEKEVPIHTSLNLTVLPTSDSTHSFAKIFEEEEEEQGDPFAPPVTTVLSEQTSQATVPPSPISSKASTSLNQTPPSILSRASDNDDVQVYDKSHPHSTNLFEGVDHGDIKEAGMVQNEYKSNVEPSSLTRGEQESPYSKDQLTDSQPSSAIPTTPFIAISQDEYLEIVEVRGEEGALILETPHPSSLTSKEEPIPMSLNFTFLSRSPSTNVKIFEEEEKGGLITTPRHESDMKAVSSLPPRKERKTSNQGDPFVPPMLVISSERQASDTILPLSFVPSKALMSPKQISMSTSSQSTYSGRNVQENVGTINNQPLHETLDAIQISSQLAECGSSELASSICDTKNASSVVGMKEIVNMMKLEGDEPSILAEAFKAKPQLCLSSEDRSTELLCYSYRVLINILNILATRSPFTITEVDKRLLVKNLKDASILGFDKDWLKSIRIKVFNCDASELHHKQQVLKSLGNNLEANKRELANVRNQEAKATQSVEIAQKDLEATHKELEAAFKGLEAAQSHLNVAQQQYANIRVRHSQLLEECQEILEQRDQCTEIIAAKLRPFGF